MTKQYLKSKVCQHKYDSRPINKDRNGKTTLAVHHFGENYDFDIENDTILQKERIYRQNVQNLSSIHHNVLDKYKRRFLS